MIGDLILFIKKKYKQLICIHDYKIDKIGWNTGLYNGFCCSKCEKYKINV